MIGLIGEIQKSIIAGDRRIEDVLRMALAAATKLGVTQIRSWIDYELNGYRGVKHDEIPSYREIHGAIKVFNPHQGWQPLFIEDEDRYNALAIRRLDSKISAISSLLDENDDGLLVMSYPPVQLGMLQKAIGANFDIQLHVGRNSLAGVIDSVRTSILSWALELETKGIVGDGMSFSPQEKQAAQLIHIENVGVFSAGVIGSVGDHANVKNVSSTKIPDKEIGEIIELLSELKIAMNSLDRNFQSEINGSISTIETELSGKRDSGRVKSAMSAIGRTLENALGGLIANSTQSKVSELIQRIGNFLGAL